MAYFATNGAVSTSEIDGGIAITDAQYQDGIEALVSGRDIAVIDEVLIIRDKQPSPNHQWLDGAWVDVTPEPEPSTPPQPRSTAMWRARAIAKATTHGEGTLFDAVVAAIVEISDPTIKAAAEEAWERGTTFDLDGQLVPMLATAVGLTEVDVLDLISQAEQLPA